MNYSLRHILGNVICCLLSICCYLPAHALQCQSKTHLARPSHALICKDAKTLALYQDLTRSYQAQIQGSDQASTVKNIHQQWQKKVLASCRQTPCLQQAIQEQILWLQQLEKKSPLIQQWAGQYKRHPTASSDHTIAVLNVVVFQDGIIAVKGLATWQGFDQTDLNIGQIQASNHLLSSELLSIQAHTDCIIHLRKLNHQRIEVQEQTLNNGKASRCGGRNVQFDGVYTKT